MRDSIVRDTPEFGSYVVLSAKCNTSVPCLARYSIGIPGGCQTTTYAQIPNRTEILADLNKQEYHVLSNRELILGEITHRLYPKFSSACEKNEFDVYSIDLQIDNSKLPLFDMREATVRDILEIWCK